MAEGLLKKLYSQKFIVESAGFSPSELDPYAIEVMKEIGIDISHQTAKNLETFIGTDFDYVITLCEDGKETCPIFHGGKKYLHRSFDDPTKTNGNNQRKTERYRRVRDEIQKWIENTFEKNDILYDDINR
jgi:arsenate reductase